MTQTVLNDLKDTGNQLLLILSSFSEEQINVSPFEGNWTGAQVADHLLKSTSGIVKLLNGSAKKTHRQADEKVPGIKALFLDFSLRFKSAEQIMPSDLPQEKDNLLKALREQLSVLYEAAETLDLSEICLGVEVPTFGLLTRLEWLYLVCYQTQRHIFQLEDILQKTKNSNHLCLKETP